MGFLIAAVLTAILAVLLIGFYALRAAGPPVRLPLLAGVLATPLHAASLFLVRMPLHGVLVTALPSGVLFWVASLYAPLLEEPAKWLVLFLPFIRARLTPANAAGIALAVGLGFGLGEIVNLAALTMLHAPETTQQAFYIYNGFMVERLIVCFLHGAMIVPVAQRLADGRPVWPGLLIGMALHYLVNFPLVMAEVEPFGIGRGIWIGLAMPWLTLMALGLAVYLVDARRRRTGGSVLGEAVCEACGTSYPRSLLAFNLGPWKLQRCPHCGRWQLAG